MTLRIKPSSVNGTIEAPASKSFMQRAIVASMLSNGVSKLEGCSFCDDTEAVLNIAKQLGSNVQISGRYLEIIGNLSLPNEMLNCNESGLALRMLSPIISLFTSSTKITGNGTLLNRPFDKILDVFEQLNVTATSNNSKLPLTIGGNLEGGFLKIDGSKGSQLLTGLLMALPLAKNDSKIIVHDLKSKPYIDMTLEVLNAWNIEVSNYNYKEFSIRGNQSYKSTHYTIEGDWSSAAFLLVAGAISGSVTVTGMNKNSKQADKIIVEVLNKVGADISFTNNAITVKKNTLNGFDFDASNAPDLFPPLAALAVHCTTPSTILGVSRLYSKESNRAKSLVDIFSKLGATIHIEDDRMMINPATLRECTIHSHNDHRIAMAATIAVLGSDFGANIEGFECINKSYPEFYNDLKTITQP